MINNAKNKITGGEGTAPLEEFHFAGSGEYVPQTITATSREAAEQEWLRTRKPVKVEPLKEKDNETQS